MGGAVVRTSTFADIQMNERSIGALEAELADRGFALSGPDAGADGVDAEEIDRFCDTACACHDEGPQAGADDCRGRLVATAARLAYSEAVNAQIRASEDMHRRLLAAMTDGVTLLSGDGRIEMANAPALALFGRDDLVGRFWPDLWTQPEFGALARGSLDAAREGRTQRFQAPVGDGGEAPATWLDITVSPMPPSAGGEAQVLAVARDITELKTNEARQSLLMQELAHRIKNTLAIVQAVATQTLRNAVSLDAASEALGSRLIALAHAHDVLMQGSWSSACLRGLVESAVALHGDGEPDRFRLSGPDITLGPRPGLTLALMLHELGTNAAKYGALSSPEGHVAVSWEVVERDGADHLRFRWEEIGGPPVSPPTRVGFGSRMIERSLVHSFGGSVALSYPPTGAVLTLEAALAAVVADAL